MWDVPILAAAAAAAIDKDRALAAAGVALVVAAGVYLARNLKKPEDKKGKELQWKKKNSTRQT